MGNQFRTTILLALMTAFIIWIGQLLGGKQGMIIALILAAGMNFFSYWYSDRLVLKSVQAREISPRDNPKLYGMVAELAQNAGLPVPRIYVIPQQAPNAFATGRNPEHAVVAVTEGLLALMDREEIKGVLAHELAHIKNRDILIGSIAATMAGAIMILASMARWSAFLGGGGHSDEEGGGLGFIGLMVMSVLAPLAAMLIQMAISRSREYQADSTGASFAGRSEGLARALEKLGSYKDRLPMKAAPATAHMFIINPLRGSSMLNLFATHPPLENRIARLRGRRDSGATGKSPSGQDMRSNAQAAWDRLSKK